MADGSNINSNPTNTAAAAGVTTLTPDQISQMNAQTQAYQQQAAALQAQNAAQNAATTAGPQLQYNPLNADGTLQDQFKIGGTAGASGYTDALQKQQDIMGSQGRDTAAAQAQTGANQAAETLAMRGGAGSNNLALLQNTALKTGLQGQQAASQTAQTNNANIGVQGAEAQLKIDQANTANKLSSAQNVNTFNLDKYNQNMAVQAANSEAQSTEAAANSGKK